MALLVTLGGAPSHARRFSFRDQLDPRLYFPAGRAIYEFCSQGSRRQAVAGLVDAKTADAKALDVLTDAENVNAKALAGLATVATADDRAVDATIPKTPHDTENAEKADDKVVAVLTDNRRQSCRRPRRCQKRRRQGCWRPGRCRESRRSGYRPAIRQGSRRQSCCRLGRRRDRRQVILQRAAPY